MPPADGKRNLRNFWLLGPEPYPEAHFAVYPTEIPRRAILAGTSAKGCCPGCGAPWRRVLGRGMPSTDRPQSRRALELAKKHGLTDEHLAAIRSVGVGDAGKNRQTQTGTGHNHPVTERLAAEAKAVLGGYFREFLLGAVETVGWEPSCKHVDVEPAPCRVLDPFSGAATTGLVATRLGRAYVGLELNPAYVEMSRRRIVNDAPMFNGLGVSA